MNSQAEIKLLGLWNWNQSPKILTWQKDKSLRTRKIETLGDFWGNSEIEACKRRVQLDISVEVKAIAEEVRWERKRERV